MASPVFHWGEDLPCARIRCEICRAIEFEDTFVKLRPSDGAQVFFFRGGLDGPSGLLDVIMQANNGGNDQNEADSLNRSSSTRRITIVNACIVT